MKLRTRFIIIFLSIILIPLFFMGIIIYKNSERIILKSTLRHLETLSILTEARVEDVYARYMDHLRIASRRLSLLQSLEVFFKEDSLETRQAVKDSLIVFDPVSTNTEEIFVFDMNGDLIAATANLWDGKNVKQELFFQKAQQGDFFDLIKTNLDSSYPGTMILSTAVKLEDHIQAVLLIMLNSEPFSEISHTYLKIGESEDVILGRRNANGDAEFITPRRFENEETAINIIPKDQTKVPMLRAVYGEKLLLDNAIDYRGKKVLAATNYIENLGIGVVVKIDKSEFLKPINELNKITIFFGGVLVFFTIFLALIISRSLSVPIEKLSRSAKDISFGKSSEGFILSEDQQEGELGDLSKALHNMSQKLISTNKGLEDQVQVRTEELQKRISELELFNKVSTGREFQMIELKKRINQLSKELNLKEPYDLSFLNEKKE